MVPNIEEKSKAFIEDRCLAVARERAWGGMEIQKITIRRVNSKHGVANWEVSQITPSVPPMIHLEVLLIIAPLRQHYALPAANSVDLQSFDGS